jgi:hypothetical protein
MALVAGALKSILHDLSRPLVVRSSIDDLVIARTTAAPVARTAMRPARRAAATSGARMATPQPRMAFAA